jgi:membrane peptidoglycan carboxypeptidase
MENERDEAPTVRDGAGRVSHAGRQALAFVTAAATIGVLVAGMVLPLAWFATGVTREVTSDVGIVPEQVDVRPLPQRSTILDADGNVLAHVFDENRVSVPLDEVSRTFLEALLAVEDSRFYEHSGVDLQGTLRALVANVGSGSVVQGGSSLTQQLVKQTLVTQARNDADRRDATEQTIARKVRELGLAIALERDHSKDWILERYVNTAYFGAGAHGIQAAAEHYFGVDAADLDLRQSALLAGLVQSPSAYDPTDAERRGRARERRATVLQRMAGLGLVGERRARRVARSGLGLDVSPVRNGCLPSEAPFLCDYAVQYVLDDPALGATRQQRQRRLREGGLTIRTTFDLRYQRAAERAVAARTDPTDAAIGAVAMVEPGSGDVLALAQSRPMGGETATGETFVNHGVPPEYGGSQGFQAGSTFKTFVLAAAVEQGIALDTTYATPDTMSFDQADYANCAGAPPYVGDFTVGNDAAPSDGSENLYSGTRLSINTFYLRLAQETGICAPYDLARDLGVRLTAPEGADGVQPERVPIFPLGVADVSPLEMAEAYASFAARGLHCDARPVAEVQGADGDVLSTHPPSCQQVVAPTTADAVNDVLRGVLEPGGFASAAALGKPAAGKTGNNEGLSVWVVGHTPAIATAAVIAGVGAEGSPALLQGSVVGGTVVGVPSASAYAAPLWGDAMRGVEDLLPDEDFAYPATVPGAGAE